MNNDKIDYIDRILNPDKYKEVQPEYSEQQPQAPATPQNMALQGLTENILTPGERVNVPDNVLNSPDFYGDSFEAYQRRQQAAINLHRKSPVAAVNEDLQAKSDKERQRLETRNRRTNAYFMDLQAQGLDPDTIQQYVKAQDNFLKMSVQQQQANIDGMLQGDPNAQVDPLLSKAMEDGDITFIRDNYGNDIADHYAQRVAGKAELGLRAFGTASPTENNLLDDAVTVGTGALIGINDLFKAGKGVGLAAGSATGAYDDDEVYNSIMEQAQGATLNSKIDKFLHGLQSDANQVGRLELAARNQSTDQLYAQVYRDEILKGATREEAQAAARSATEMNKLSDMVDADGLVIESLAGEIPSAFAGAFIGKGVMKAGSVIAKAASKSGFAGKLASRLTSNIVKGVPKAKAENTIISKTADFLKRWAPAALGASTEAMFESAGVTLLDVGAELAAQPVEVLASAPAFQEMLSENAEEQGLSDAEFYQQDKYGNYLKDGNGNLILKTADQLTPDLQAIVNKTQRSYIVEVSKDSAQTNALIEGAVAGLFPFAEHTILHGMPGLATGAAKDAAKAAKGVAQAGKSAITGKGKYSIVKSAIKGTSAVTAGAAKIGFRATKGMAGEALEEGIAEGATTYAQQSKIKEATGGNLHADEKAGVLSSALFGSLIGAGTVATIAGMKTAGAVASLRSPIGAAVDNITSPSSPISRKINRIFGNDQHVDKDPITGTPGSDIGTPGENPTLDAVTLAAFDSAVKGDITIPGSKKEDGTLDNDKVISRYTLAKVAGVYGGIPKDGKNLNQFKAFTATLAGWRALSDDSKEGGKQRAELRKKTEKSIVTIQGHLAELLKQRDELPKMKHPTSALIKKTKDLELAIGQTQYELNSLGGLLDLLAETPEASATRKQETERLAVNYMNSLDSAVDTIGAQLYEKNRELSTLDPEADKDRFDTLSKELVQLEAKQEQYFKTVQNPEFRQVMFLNAKIPEPTEEHSESFQKEVNEKVAAFGTQTAKERAATIQETVRNLFGENPLHSKETSLKDRAKQANLAASQRYANKLNRALLKEYISQAYNDKNNETSIQDLHDAFSKVLLSAEGNDKSPTTAHDKLVSAYIKSALETLADENLSAATKIVSLEAMLGTTSNRNVKNSKSESYGELDYILDALTFRSGDTDGRKKHTTNLKDSELTDSEKSSELFDKIVEKTKSLQKMNRFKSGLYEKSISLYSVYEDLKELKDNPPTEAVSSKSRLSQYTLTPNKTKEGVYTLEVTRSKGSQDKGTIFRNNGTIDQLIERLSNFIVPIQQDVERMKVTHSAIMAMNSPKSKLSDIVAQLEKDLQRISEIKEPLIPEEPKETVAEKSKDKAAEKSKDKAAEKSKDKAAEKSKDNVSEESEDEENIPDDTADADKSVDSILNAEDIFIDAVNKASAVPDYVSHQRKAIINIIQKIESHWRQTNKTQSNGVVPFDHDTFREGFVKAFQHEFLLKVVKPALDKILLETPEKLHKDVTNKILSSFTENADVDFIINGLIKEVNAFNLSDKPVWEGNTFGENSQEDFVESILEGTAAAIRDAIERKDTSFAASVLTLESNDMKFTENGKDIPLRHAPLHLHDSLILEEGNPADKDSWTEDNTAEVKVAPKDSNEMLAAAKLIHKADAVIGHSSALLEDPIGHAVYISADSSLNENGNVIGSYELTPSTPLDADWAVAGNVIDDILANVEDNEKFTFYLRIPDTWFESEEVQRNVYNYYAATLQYIGFTGAQVIIDDHSPKQIFTKTLNIQDYSKASARDKIRWGLDTDESYVIPRFHNGDKGSKSIKGNPKFNAQFKNSEGVIEIGNKTFTDNIFVENFQTVESKSPNSITLIGAQTYTFNNSTPPGVVPKFNNHVSNRFPVSGVYTLPVDSADASTHEHIDKSRDRVYQSLSVELRRLTDQNLGSDDISYKHIHLNGRNAEGDIDPNARKIPLTEFTQVDEQGNLYALTNPSNPKTKVVLGSNEDLDALGVSNWPFKSKVRRWKLLQDYKQRSKELLDNQLLEGYSAEINLEWYTGETDKNGKKITETFTVPTYVAIMLSSNGFTNTSEGGFNLDNLRFNPKPVRFDDSATSEVDNAFINSLAVLQDVVADSMQKASATYTLQHPDARDFTTLINSWASLFGGVNKNSSSTANPATREPYSRDNKNVGLSPAAFEQRQIAYVLNFNKAQEIRNEILNPEDSDEKTEVLKRLKIKAIPLEGGLQIDGNIVELDEDGNVTGFDVQALLKKYWKDTPNKAQIQQVLFKLRDQFKQLLDIELVSPTFTAPILVDAITRSIASLFTMHSKGSPFKVEENFSLAFDGRTPSQVIFTMSNNVSLETIGGNYKDKEVASLGSMLWRHNTAETEKYPDILKFGRKKGDFIETLGEAMFKYMGISSKSGNKLSSDEIKALKHQLGVEAYSFMQANQLLIETSAYERNQLFDSDTHPLFNPKDAGSTTFNETWHGVPDEAEIGSYLGTWVTPIWSLPPEHPLLVSIDTMVYTLLELPDGVSENFLVYGLIAKAFRTLLESPDGNLPEFYNRISFDASGGHPPNPSMELKISNYLAGYGRNIKSIKSFYTRNHNKLFATLGQMALTALSKQASNVLDTSRPHVEGVLVENVKDVTVSFSTTGKYSPTNFYGQNITRTPNNVMSNDDSKNLETLLEMDNHEVFSIDPNAAAFMVAVGHWREDGEHKNSEDERPDLGAKADNGMDLLLGLAPETDPSLLAASRQTNTARNLQNNSTLVRINKLLVGILREPREDGTRLSISEAILRMPHFFTTNSRIMTDAALSPQGMKLFRALVPPANINTKTGEIVRDVTELEASSDIRSIEYVQQYLLDNQHIAKTIAQQLGIKVTNKKVDSQEYVNDIINVLNSLTDTPIPEGEVLNPDVLEMLKSVFNVQLQGEHLMAYHDSVVKNSTEGEPVMPYEEYGEFDATQDGVRDSVDSEASKAAAEGLAKELGNDVALALPGLQLLANLMIRNTSIDPHKDTDNRGTYEHNLMYEHDGQANGASNITMQSDFTDLAFNPLMAAATGSYMGITLLGKNGKLLTDLSAFSLRESANDLYTIISNAMHDSVNRNRDALYNSLYEPIAEGQPSLNDLLFGSDYSPYEGDLVNFLQYSMEDLAEMPLGSKDRTKIVRSVANGIFQRLTGLHMAFDTDKATGKHFNFSIRNPDHSYLTADDFNTLRDNFGLALPGSALGHLKGMMQATGVPQALQENTIALKVVHEGKDDKFYDVTKESYIADKALLKYLAHLMILQNSPGGNTSPFTDVMEMFEQAIEALDTAETRDKSAELSKHLNASTKESNDIMANQKSFVSYLQQGVLLGILKRKGDEPLDVELLHKAPLSAENLIQLIELDKIPRSMGKQIATPTGYAGGIKAAANQLAKFAAPDLVSQVQTMFSKFYKLASPGNKDKTLPSEAKDSINDILTKGIQVFNLKMSNLNIFGEADSRHVDKYTAFRSLFSIYRKANEISEMEPGKAQQEAVDELNEEFDDLMENSIWADIVEKDEDGNVVSTISLQETRDALTDYYNTLLDTRSGAPIPSITTKTSKYKDSKDDSDDYFEAVRFVRVIKQLANTVAYEVSKADNIGQNLKEIGLRGFDSIYSQYPLTYKNLNASIAHSSSLFIAPYLEYTQAYMEAVKKRNAKLPKDTYKGISKAMQPLSRAEIRDIVLNLKNFPATTTALNSKQFGLMIEELYNHSTPLVKSTNRGPDPLDMTASTNIVHASNVGNVRVTDRGDRNFPTARYNSNVEEHARNPDRIRNMALITNVFRTHSNLFESAGAANAVFTVVSIEGKVVVDTYDALFDDKKLESILGPELFAEYKALGIQPGITQTFDGLHTSPQLSKYMGILYNHFWLQAHLHYSVGLAMFEALNRTGIANIIADFSGNVSEAYPLYLKLLNSHPINSPNFDADLAKLAELSPQAALYIRNIKNPDLIFVEGQHESKAMFRPKTLKELIEAEKTNSITPENFPGMNEVVMTLKDLQALIAITDTKNALELIGNDTAKRENSAFRDVLEQYLQRALAKYADAPVKDPALIELTALDLYLSPEGRVIQDNRNGGTKFDAFLEWGMKPASMFAEPVIESNSSAPKRVIYLGDTPVALHNEALVKLSHTAITEAATREVYAKLIPMGIDQYGNSDEVYIHGRDKFFDADGTPKEGTLLHRYLQWKADRNPDAELTVEFNNPMSSLMSADDRLFAEFLSQDNIYQKELHDAVMRLRNKHPIRSYVGSKGTLEHIPSGDRDSLGAKLLDMQRTPHEEKASMTVSEFLSEIQEYGENKDNAVLDPTFKKTTPSHLSQMLKVINNLWKNMGLDTYQNAKVYFNAAAFQKATGLDFVPENSMMYKGHIFINFKAKDARRFDGTGALLNTSFVITEGMHEIIHVLTSAIISRLKNPNSVDGYVASPESKQALNELEALMQTFASNVMESDLNKLSQILGHHYLDSSIDSILAQNSVSIVVRLAASIRNAYQKGASDIGAQELVLKEFLAYSLTNTEPLNILANRGDWASVSNSRKFRKLEQTKQAIDESIRENIDAQVENLVTDKNSQALITMVNTSQKEFGDVTPESGLGNILDYYFSGVTPKDDADKRYRINKTGDQIPGLQNVRELLNDLSGTYTTAEMNLLRAYVKARIFDMLRTRLENSTAEKHKRVFDYAKRWNDHYEKKVTDHLSSLRNLKTKDGKVKKRSSLLNQLFSILAAARAKIAKLLNIDSRSQLATVASALTVLSNEQKRYFEHEAAREALSRAAGGDTVDLEAINNLFGDTPTNSYESLDDIPKDFSDQSGRDAFNGNISKAHAERLDKLSETFYGYVRLYRDMNQGINAYPDEYSIIEDVVDKPTDTVMRFKELVNTRYPDLSVAEEIALQGTLALLMVQDSLSNTAVSGPMNKLAASIVKYMNSVPKGKNNLTAFQKSIIDAFAKSPEAIAPAIAALYLTSEKFAAEVQAVDQFKDTANFKEAMRLVNVDMYAKRHIPLDKFDKAVNKLIKEAVKVNFEQKRNQRSLLQMHQETLENAQKLEKMEKFLRSFPGGESSVGAALYGIAADAKLTSPSNPDGQGSVHGFLVRMTKSLEQNYGHLLGDRVGGIATLMKAFLGNDKTSDYAIDAKASHAIAVDATRENVTTASENSMRSAFNGTLTKVMEKALDNIMLPLNFARVAKILKRKEIHAVLTDEASRSQTIAKLETEVKKTLEKLYPGDFNKGNRRKLFELMMYQTQVMAEFAVKGEAKEFAEGEGTLALNSARRVAMLGEFLITNKDNKGEALVFGQNYEYLDAYTLTPEEQKTFNRLSDVISTITTMNGLSYVADTDVSNFSKFFAEKPPEALGDYLYDGISTVIDYAQEQDPYGFDGMNGYDGYEHNKRDDTKDGQLVLASNVKRISEMEKAGYYRHSTREHGKYVFMVNPMTPSRKYAMGVFGIVSTSIGGVTADQRGIYAKPTRGVHALNPRIDDDGYVVDQAALLQRYFIHDAFNVNTYDNLPNEMSSARLFSVTIPKALDDKIFTPVERGIKSIANYHGRMVEQTAVITNNKDMMRMLAKVHREDRDVNNRYFLLTTDSGYYKKLAQKHPSAAKALKNLVNSLPPENRKDLYEFGGDNHGVWVNEYVLNQIVGYQKWNLNDALYGNSYNIPAWLQHAIKPTLKLMFSTLATVAFPLAPNATGANVAAFLQRGLEEAVSLGKDTVLLRSVVVPLGNLVSNAVHLWATGIPIAQGMKDMREGWILAKQFRQDSLYYESMRQEIGLKSTSKARKRQLQTEMEMLRNKLDNSPVRDLVEHGFLTSITSSDINLFTDDPHSLLTKFKSHKLNPMAYLPHDQSSIGKAIGNVVISRGSTTHKFFEDVMDFGDFSAKYAIYKELHTRKGYEAKAVRRMIRDEFVNYNFNKGWFFDALNDTGVTWFLAFNIGIQKIIAKTFARHGLRAATSYIGGGYTYDHLGLDTVPMNNIFDKPFWDKMNPDMITDAFSTHYIQRSIRELMDLIN